jgi:hypothetical protein
MPNKETGVRFFTDLDNYESIGEDFESLEKKWTDLQLHFNHWLTINKEINL